MTYIDPNLCTTAQTYIIRSINVRALERRSFRTHTKYVAQILRLDEKARGWRFKSAGSENKKTRCVEGIGSPLKISNGRGQRAGGECLRGSGDFVRRLGFSGLFCLLRARDGWDSSSVEGDREGGSRRLSDVGTNSVYNLVVCRGDMGARYIYITIGGKCYSIVIASPCG